TALTAILGFVIMGLVGWFVVCPCLSRGPAPPLGPSARPSARPSAQFGQASTGRPPRRGGNRGGRARRWD
ncbi:hypothetical protein ACFXDF_28005, partial [Streptomyces sp. NPDC059426]|uniref:hypothetical protein n=1 Tax=Streptomyces sp. NPDC059426 TaxID=3346827 RepID=UPI0036A64ACF